MWWGGGVVQVHRCLRIPTTNKKKWRRNEPEIQLAAPDKKEEKDNVDVDVTMVQSISCGIEKVVEDRNRELQ